MNEQCTFVWVSIHSFHTILNFKIVLSKPIGIWVWTLKQSCWSFYFQQVCFKDLVEILNGLREFLKKRKTALSYSNLPWLFSLLLSLFLTVAVAIGAFSCCVVQAADWLARAAPGESKVFFSSSLDVEPVDIASVFVFASPQRRRPVLLAGKNSPSIKLHRPIALSTSFALPLRLDWAQPSYCYRPESPCSPERRRDAGASRHDRRRRLQKPPTHLGFI